MNELKLNSKESILLDECYKFIYLACGVVVDRKGDHYAMTTIDSSAASTLAFYAVNFQLILDEAHTKKKFIHETDEIRADGLLMIYKFITVSVVWIWIVRK